jgi:nucleotide-binding universal stress UspA family protein
MKTIIVATDYSANAGNALRYAGSLAAFTNASILLFNAYQLPVHASNARISAAAVDDLIHANRHRLKKLAAFASKEFGVKVSVETRLVELSKGLEELVHKENAELVVVGSHTNDWSDRLFGNHTTGVIRNAKYPVLIVPPFATFNSVKKILYAFDNSRVSAPETLSILSEVASRFNAEVQVFHVMPQAGEIAAEVGVQPDLCPEVEFALRNVRHDYKDVFEELVVDGIEREIRETKADLLVMVPHKLNFWESLFHQSTTRSMALRAHIPILVLPGNRVNHGWNGV